MAVRRLRSHTTERGLGRDEKRLPKAPKEKDKIKGIGLLDTQNREYFEDEQ